MNRLQTACAMDYEHVERMIDKICWDFYRTHGGDWEELRSVANEGFMEAWGRYDSRRAQFTTYCWWWVWGLLMKQNEKKIKEPTMLEKPDTIICKSCDLESLSEDANLVIRVLFNLVKVDKTEKKAKIRQRIRTQLIEHLGWTTKRITESFKEIQEALG